MEQISRAAKTTKLNRGSSTTAEKDGMKVTVTPADLSRIKSSKDLEKGQIAAVVDVNGIPELPNGRYNVFLLKANDRWQAFLESGGKIAADFKRVELSSTKPDETNANHAASRRSSWHRVVGVWRFARTVLVGDPV